MMKVFQFCIYTLIFSLSACTDTAKTSPETHVAPHIVILIADDLGLKRAPCYAQNSPMRFLSRQCDKAVVFERAYTHPYCTASRAAMMTARHTFRHGAGDVRAEATKLPLTETTLPEALKQGGAKNYRFSAFGKWHLADDGNGDVNNPNLQGFDNFEGNPRQHHTYSYFNYDWYKNGTFVGNIPTYKTTKITDTIIDDFKSHAGHGPQFYWAGFVSPHMPYHTPPEGLHHHTELPKGFIWQPVRKRPPNTDEFTINKRDPRLDPYFMAMLEALDHEIERLVTHLSAQSDRPIVFVFLGDNGTSAEVYPGDRSIGYRAKTQLYDGGTRIPFMIWSTDNQAVGFRRGRVKAMVHLVDLLPTIADITHAKPIYPKAIDGQSFYKVLTSSIEPIQHTRDYIYLELGNLAKLPFSYGAVNRDGLKLILREKQRYQPKTGMAPIELYDTDNDPQEAENLFLKPCHMPQENVAGLYEFIKTKLASEPDNHTSFNPKDYDTEIKDFINTCPS